MKRTSLIIALAITVSLNMSPVYSQNYWGEGHIQSMDNSYEIVEEENMSVDLIEEAEIEDAKVEKTFSKSKKIKDNSKTAPTRMIELGAKTEKIPTGTKLNIVMNNYLDAKESRLGDPFAASIQKDVKVGDEVVLPAGTVIRGRVGKIKKPGFFSKSGSIILNFDHIVTPLGKQIVLDVDLTKTNNVDKKGALVANDGFVGAIKDSAKTGYNTTKTVTVAGYKAGMAAGKVPVIATVPVTAVAGTLAGTTVFATKSAIAIFKKGGNPVIQSGDCLEIDFSEELDLPVN